MEDAVIWPYVFTALWCILWPFGIFYGRLEYLWLFGIYFPVLACSTKNNLATLS
jgi:hypothetical protein